LKQFAYFYANVHPHPIHIILYFFLLAVTPEFDVRMLSTADSLYDDE